MTDTADRTSHAGEGKSPGHAYAEILRGLRHTFASGRTRPLAWRTAQLDGLLRMLDDHEAELIEALHADLGRPATEALGADISHSRAEVAFIRKHVARWMKPRRVNPGLTSLPGTAKVISEPLGVALVIAPWNYPIQLLVEPLAAALAAGNCVVAKPSELAPACSAALARLLPRYLDDEAVVVAEGAVPETTALLEQRFDHIFFTGSTAVGQVVMEAAAKHLTPVTLELGGKSPAIVAADADLDIAARRIAWGKCFNAGQTCVAPDYVLADSAIRDELVDKISATIDGFYKNDPKGSADFGRIVNERHVQRLQGLLDGHGGTLARGGEVDEAQRFLAPTIVVDPNPDSSLMRDEIFGPILPVLAVESVDEAIAFVNDRAKPLALYVFSRSGALVDDVLGRTSSGGACINHTLMHLVSPNLPFGGVGGSGMGAYHGKAGYDAFTHHRSVLSKPSRPDPSILYPPYTKLKHAILRKVL